VCDAAGQRANGLAGTGRAGLVRCGCKPLFDVFSKRCDATAKHDEPQVPNFARMSHSKSGIASKNAEQRKRQTEVSRSYPAHQMRSNAGADADARIQSRKPRYSKCTRHRQATAVESARKVATARDWALPLAQPQIPPPPRRTFVTTCLPPCPQRPEKRALTSSKSPPTFTNQKKKHLLHRTHYFLARNSPCA
jgi:hypothetical protein